MRKTRCQIKYKFKSWMLVEKFDGLGLGRQECAKRKLLASLSSKKACQSTLIQYWEWREANGLPFGQQDQLIQLKAYMEEMKEIYQQKTLDQHRAMLSLVYKKNIPKYKSEVLTVVESRSYFLSEILLIIYKLEERNAIAILLCFFAGMRAHELCTLQSANLDKKSTTRKWSENRFQELRRFAVYIVKGKGGLKREVAIPIELAEVLESRRFSTPKHVKDRGINYIQNFDIGYGAALSQSFTRASIKHLEWTSGLHGTRHSYAKNRLFKLLDAHLSFAEASAIISQELGHFRPFVTNTYLR